MQVIRRFSPIDCTRMDCSVLRPGVCQVTGFLGKVYNTIHIQDALSFGATSRMVSSYRIDQRPIEFR